MAKHNPLKLYRELTTEQLQTLRWAFTLDRANLNAQDDNGRAFIDGRVKLIDQALHERKVTP